ncbi:Phosphotransferase enzyme family protein [Tolypocladium paradoxum]|uniref:Phosphotransferase enzyme family protein n=1 Tax=Tolypocladium paradoxum TaxID=94208 RepID=A0A2S4KYS6_9HYPO|nr:Phosphotransferase enzyme family protein [Tolypocladium paradoxum]
MAAQDTHRPLIDISSLPDISKAEMDFHDSSFFRCNARPQLPTPTAILQQFPDRGATVVKFEHLNLAVKYGHSSYPRLEEAQTMRAIRQAFPHDDIPVPEVFGWRKHGDLNFIYMSLIRGKTLREAWPSLTEGDKMSISSELRRIVAALRRATQGSSERFIGSINGGTVQDRFFKLDYEEGPFLTIKSFNDWLFAAATRQRPGPDGVIKGLDLDGLYRDFIADTGNIYLTHGDLTVGNIIISGIPGSHRIVGIIDWEQAGWYPEYWEYCKLLYGVEYSHEWRSAGWADKVVTSFDNEWTAVAEYSLWRCP